MSTTRQRKTSAGNTAARSRGRRRPGRGWYYVTAGVLGLVLLGASQPPSAPPPPAAPNAPRPTDKGAAPNAAPASPMDEPLRLIHKAQEAYRSVQDYTCLLIKQERMNGVLPPRSVVEMKVRTQPFSVYLRWLQPREEAGQEVCYVAGRYDGKMRVRSKGLLGAVGFVSLDPNDPRARQTSRRSITEAGIGSTIDRLARAWENEKRNNLPTQVRVAEYEYNQRRCYRVEMINPNNANGQLLYYRDVVYFDKETHLPIRLEFYDWPRQQGDTGQLVEVYSFANMRTNVGLSDAVFNH